MSQQIDLLDLEINLILSYFIGIISTKSLQYLGIEVRARKDIVKDLEKARLSIDTLIFMVDKLEPFINEEEKKQLRQLVSNLQFTFFTRV
jgi:hypothetical protein